MNLIIGSASVPIMRVRGGRLYDVGVETPPVCLETSSLEMK